MRQPDDESDQSDKESQQSDEESHKESAEESGQSDGECQQSDEESHKESTEECDQSDVECEEPEPLHREKSRENWIKKLSIPIALKESIMAGDVASTRRLIKTISATPQLDEYVRESQAYIHLAILGGGTAFPVASALVCEYKSELQKHLGNASFPLTKYKRLPALEGGTPLHMAVAFSHYKMVDLLLTFRDEVKIGLDDQSKYATHHTAQPSVTLYKCVPLALAIAYDDVRMLKMLTAAGADIKQCDSMGRVPMHIAFEIKAVHCIDYLVHRYSSEDLGVSDESFATLIQSNSKDTVSLVLGAFGGSLIGPKSLHNACFCDMECFRLLFVAVGPEAWNMVWQMMTPLITIAYYSQDEADAVQKSKLLLRSRADPRHTRCGKTAAKYAEERGFASLAQLLQQASTEYRDNGSPVQETTKRLRIT